jgi:hypothetical protein
VGGVNDESVIDGAQRFQSEVERKKVISPGHHKIACVERRRGRRRFFSRSFIDRAPPFTAGAFFSTPVE